MPEVATFRTKPLNLPGLFIKIGLQKLNRGGPDPLVVNIIVNYCCTRKMLKETEETAGFSVTFLLLVAIQLGVGASWLRPCLKIN